MDISEQNFKIVLDTVWNMFVKSVNMTNVLESIGLDINMEEKNISNVSGCTGMHELYSIRDLAAVTILKIVGLNTELPGSNERTTILEELDQFFYDLCVTFTDSSRFPKEVYSRLLEILTVSGGIKLPWKKDMNGHNIEGAYWNEKLFGKFDKQKTQKMLREEGLAKYETKIFHTGGVIIWAHSNKEAMVIGNNLTDDEIEMYVSFDRISATDAYEV